MQPRSLRHAANRYLKTDSRGQFRDKKHRAFIIHKMIDDLYTVGNAPLSWQKTQTSHIKNLVKHWQKQKLKPATLMKYMTVIRKFLSAMNCVITHIDNQSLGLSRINTCRKQIKIQPNIWQSIIEPCTRFIMALQSQFGLSFSEAIRLIPDIHTKQDTLWITREIAFNSQDRFIPIRHEAQLQLIHTLISHTQGNKSLLQLHGTETIRYLWREALAKQNLPSNKNYRYLYAQQLRRELQPTLGNYQTSWLIRDEMGIKSRNTLWRYLHEQ